MAGPRLFQHSLAQTKARESFPVFGLQSGKTKALA
jgi:hypothetical protein